MNVIENLLNAIETMEIDTLRETLAYLLKIYVIDRGLTYEGIQDMQVNSHKTKKGISSFAEVIRDLKNRFSMKELDDFSIEGDCVFISIDGKKYQLTQGKTNEKAMNTPEVTKAGTSQDNESGEDIKPPCGRFEKLEMD